MTTQLYYTGASARTRILNAMYFDLKQRSMHYILGGDLEEVSESFAEQVIAIHNATPILLYPTFFKMLASDEYKLFKKTCSNLCYVFTKQWGLTTKEASFRHNLYSV